MQLQPVTRLDCPIELPNVSFNDKNKPISKFLSCIEQRKQPPMPPFGAASSAISGGPHQFHPQHSGLGPLGPKTSLAAGTLDRLKMLKPRRSVSQPGAHTENGLQQVLSLP